jgi:hypothetical protein
VLAKIADEPFLPKTVLNDLVPHSHFWS